MDLFLKSAFLLTVSFLLVDGGGLLWHLLHLPKICLCRCGLANSGWRALAGRSARLLGGEQAEPHEFPWLAAVHTPPGPAPGTLLTNRHVVTAASRVHGTPASHITVTLGAHERCGGGGLNVSVTSLLLHPHFTRTHAHNDIALLILTHAVPFSQYVSPICLPEHGQFDEGLVGTITMWRTEDSDQKMSSCTPVVSTMPILPARSCTKAARDPDLVTPDKGCLGPVGARSVVCKSDIGSGVMVRSLSGVYHLSGVVSTASCQEDASPLYTRLTDHLSWILFNVRTDCLCF